LRKNATVLGSGNWGSTIGKVIANNTKKHSDIFNETVNMYVYEEQIDGKNLSSIINEKHQNVKYLPKIELPKNLVAVPDIIQALKDADVIFFVLPFQFAKKSLISIKDSLKKDSYFVNLSKGVYYDKENDDLTLISQLAENITGKKCYTMMGANIASEVANDHLCETTIGCSDEKHSSELEKILTSETFLTETSKFVAPVELLGALKNIYAFGYGMLKEVPNVNPCTLVVLIRMAMIEMLTFTKDFCKEKEIEGFTKNKDVDLKELTLHSSAFADLYASSMAGRNSRIGGILSKDLIETGKAKTIEEYEAEHLNGQKVQGSLTAIEINKYLNSPKRNQTEKYPLMTKIHQIIIGQAKPADILTTMSKFPYSPKSI